MIIDICEIIMNNHTCEIIDFISGGKIHKPLSILYNNLSLRLATFVNKNNRKRDKATGIANKN